jgi:hypothetical protein
MKALKGWLKGLWYILTNRNFILIYGIKEIEINGQPGRTVASIRRTDCNTESDFYTMKSSMISQFGRQIMDDHAKIGDYTPKK